MENTQNGPARPELFWFGTKVKYGGLLGGDRNRSLIMSYMNLRRWIGWLGIFLPFICIAGGRLFDDLGCQSSISFYYHTNMQDFFIGILFVVSIFLITYHGDLKIDNIVTWVIGIAGIVVALFPTADPASTETHVGLFRVRADIADFIHVRAAGVFFLLLALNSLFLFTLSKHKVQPAGSRKKIRNRVYVTCGVIILVCMLLFLILGKAMGDDNFKEGGMVLLLETVMLAAFGVSWLVKGETMFFKDRKRHVEQGTAKE